MPVLTGKTVALSPSQNAADIDVIRVDARQLEASDRAVTLVARLEKNPVPVLWTSVPPVLAAQVLVKVTIINGLGVTFQRNFLLAATNPRTIEIVGAKSVVVTAALISGGNAGNPYPNGQLPPGAGTSASVTVIATTEDVDFLGYDYAVWNASGEPNNSSAGSPIAGPGALLDAQGGITNMGGASALYLWFFDAQDAYISGFTVTGGGSGYAPGTTNIGFSFTSVGAGPARIAPQGVIQVTTGGGGAITGIAFAAGTVPDFRGLMGTGMITPPTVLISGAGSSATATAQVAVSPTRYVLPVVGPFFNPAPFSLSDELKDGMFFEAGLCWGLSSDPFTFTLVSGAAARVDTKVAQ